MEGSVKFCEEEEVSCRVSTCVVERISISCAIFSAVHHKEDEAIMPGCYARSRRN